MASKPEPVPIDQPTRISLLRELAGNTCFCGARKRRRQTFCRRHYFALPEPKQTALYFRMGAGYEEAYTDAMTFFQAQSTDSNHGRS